MSSSNVKLSAAFFSYTGASIRELDCLIYYETFRILNSKRFIFPLDNYYPCMLGERMSIHVPPTPLFTPPPTFLQTSYEHLTSLSQDLR